jgi:hypothetical protein
MTGKALLRVSLNCLLLGRFPSILLAMSGLLRLLALAPLTVSIGITLLSFPFPLLSILSPKINNLFDKLLILNQKTQPH